LSHIYDDDSGIALTESLSQETEGKSEDSDAECFIEVKSSSEARHPIQKYSSYCPYEFSCSNGRHCDHKHTREEVDFFKENGGKGQKGYTRVSRVAPLPKAYASMVQKVWLRTAHFIIRQRKHAAMYAKRAI